MSKQYELKKIDRIVLKKCNKILIFIKKKRK